ncbi:MAG: YraN family protein [Anaerolineae bacterium]|jgi:putative endonuclease|nr:YraN family protein [Anaerolineae bacterium]
MNRAHQTGQQGEQIALNYLRGRGYQIVEVNWHCLEGEIDIIAQLDHLWVFVEVRTRRSELLEAALESITLSKRQKLLRAVYQYLQVHQLEECEWRIDLIAIALDRGKAQITQVENAFDW